MKKIYLLISLILLSSCGNKQNDNSNDNESLINSIEISSIEEIENSSSDNIPSIENLSSETTDTTSSDSEIITDSDIILPPIIID